MRTLSVVEATLVYTETAQYIGIPTTDQITDQLEVVLEDLAETQQAAEEQSKNIKPTPAKYLAVNLIEAVYQTRFRIRRIIESLY